MSMNTGTTQWKEVVVGQLGRVVTGKTPSKDHPEHWGDVLDFITPTDIKTTSKYLSKSARSLSEQGVNTFKRLIIPANSVIVTCIGSDMGKVLINKNNCLTNQQINSIIVNEDFDVDFVFYLLKNSYEILRLNAVGVGSTMPIINKSAFERLAFSVPPSLYEQQSISTVLSILDKKIELLRKQNETLEEMAKAIFHEWFVEFNFPDKNGKPYKASGGKMVQSELGEIPEGWRVGSLAELIEQLSQRVGSDDQSEYTVMSAVSTGQLVPSTEYFTKQVFSKSISKYIKIQKGDFAYNPARINIGSVGRLRPDILGAVSPVYVAFRAKEGAGAYVDFLIQTEKMKRHIELYANGSVRQTLGYDGFGAFGIAVPTQDILEKFDEVSVSLRTIVEQKETQIENLITIRDLLLPKLMSGEVRVNT